MNYDNVTINDYVELLKEQGFSFEVVSCKPVIPEEKDIVNRALDIEVTLQPVIRNINIKGEFND